MISRLLLSFFAAVFFGLPARAETHVDDAGRFSAEFPGAVQRGAQSVDTAVGKIAMNMVYHDAGSVAYMVIFNDYPNGSVTKSGGPDKVYDGAVNGAVSSVHGKLRSSSPSKTGEVQGREIIVDIPAQKTSDQGSVARVRFFIVGDRLYQVMYIGPAGNEAKAEATGFLDSFRLLH